MTMADAALDQAGLCHSALPRPAGADMLRMGASRHLADDDDFASTMPLSTVDRTRRFDRRLAFSPGRKRSCREP
ncbi:hypothetical protein FJ938_09955 [Mesorhizobium sp. B2-4-14]|uniref:hypothetical protein n=1 Tax=Mesorhizobium sp. B2-4-14 TaxID=2589935 RepID=UPI001126FD6D|nr:hypothetical protein [Mesorhizobium sp. B2-4-14]TPL07916.1 hypothetical protein FJ938_09955 [Mesorhizobium sp. B2-4-14]